MPKILHLATDAQFIDAAFFLYESVYPKGNDFLIILPDVKKYKIKYLSEANNYQYYTNNNKTLKIISELVKEYKVVVLHGFDFFKAQITKRNPNSTFIWTLWGGEVYDSHKALKKKLRGEKTKQLKIGGTVKTILRPLYHLIKYRFKNNYNLEALKNLDYLSVLHKEDFNLIKNLKIISTKTQYIKFTYYPIEFIFKNNKDLKINNNNILLGNSGTPTNNHIEAFDIIKQLDLHNRKVITPLSYGYTDYINLIIKTGEKELGRNFKPLIEFLPLESYNNILQTCSIVVLNHYRQKAVGNILSSMWMGAKVFLDERNTFYQYLKRIGCIVFLIEELNNENLNNLNSDQINHNRNILITEIGTESILKSLKNELDKIIN